MCKLRKDELDTFDCQLVRNFVSTLTKSKVLSQTFWTICNMLLGQKLTMSLARGGLFEGKL